MQQRTNQVLYAYWNDVRGDRLAPRRFDIEPSQIGTVLAETFILECSEPHAFIYRLAGTKICDTFGREFRGLNFLETFRDEDRQGITAHLDEVQKQGAILVLEAEAVIAKNRTARFEILLMPLIHTASSISRMLGAVAAVEPPGWLGTERLPPLDLLRHQHIWPEGRPHAIADKFRNPPALAPELVDARLVRVNRRSFRVVDGGLGKE